jgi:hypothetical protein
VPQQRVHRDDGERQPVGKHHVPRQIHVDELVWKVNLPQRGEEPSYLPRASLPQK